MVADGEKLGVTSATSSSKGIMLKREEVKQKTDVHFRDKETAETHVRFPTSDSSHNCILLGPVLKSKQVYNYLKKQAAELYDGFPASVKRCVMSVDVLVDRNSGDKENFSTSERDWFLTTSAKCLADTGSNSGVIFCDPGHDEPGP